MPAPKAELPDLVWKLGVLISKWRPDPKLMSAEAYKSMKSRIRRQYNRQHATSPEIEQVRQQIAEISMRNKTDS